MIHRQSLSVPFAIWGDDGGGVAVVTDPANVVLTGQEVLLLTDKTFTQERNARGHLGSKGQLRSQHTTMSKRSCYFQQKKGVLSQSFQQANVWVHISHVHRGFCWFC